MEGNRECVAYSTLSSYTCKALAINYFMLFYSLSLAEVPRKIIHWNRSKRISSFFLTDTGFC